MKPNTDKEKATVRQKAPKNDPNLNWAMYNPDKANQNMKTNTQTETAARWAACEAAEKELKKAQQPKSGRWSVEYGNSILEWNPNYTDGIAMLCRCHDEMEAQYTVNAHNAAIGRLEAQADKLAEALRDALRTHSDKHTVRFSEAWKALAEYEASKQ